MKFIQKYSLRFAALSLFIVALILYYPSIYNQYNIDDQLITDHNEFTSKGWKVLDIFLQPDRQSKNFELILKDRPFTLFLFGVEHALLGDDPFYSHCINLILYAILCAVMFLFLVKLFPTYKWVLYFGMLFYTIHPLHTEVVNSIKNRDQILYMLLGCLTLWMIYLFSTQKKWYYFLFFIISMYLCAMSSSFGILFLPLSILIFILYFGEKKYYHWIALAVLSYVTFKMYGMSMGYLNRNFVVEYNPQYFLENPLFTNKNIFIRLSTGFYILYQYLYKFFIPKPFCLYYGYKIVQLHQWSEWLVLLSVLLHGALLFLTYKFRKNGFLLTLAVMYFLHVLLLSNWIKMGPGGIADRWFFFGTLSLSLFMSYLVFQLIKKYSLAKYICGGVFVIYFLMAINIIRERIQDWYDLDTLVKKDAALNPESVNTQIMYLELLLQKYAKTGRTNESLKQQCKNQLDHILSFKIESFNVYHSIGYYSTLTGDYEKAEASYKNSLKLHPGNYGELLSLINLFQLSHQEEKITPMIEDFSRTNKTMLKPYLGLAKYYLTIGNREQTLATLNRGIENVAYGSDTLHYIIGEIYFQDKEYQLALPHLEKIKNVYPQAMIAEKVDICKINK